MGVAVLSRRYDILVDFATIICWGFLSSSEGSSEERGILLKVLLNDDGEQEIMGRSCCDNLFK